MKKKNRITNFKGFTLVELLAVIIILAVLALISIPIISGIIENTKKKALESSLWAIDTATKNYFSKLVLKNDTSFDDLHPRTFEISNNACVGTECLDFESDNIRAGYVSLYSNNSASICIDDGEYYANKSAADTVVVLGDGKCTKNYDVDTKKYSASNVVTEDDIKTLVDRIKELEDRADTIESNQSTMANDITTLNSSNTTMASDITSLGTRTTSLENTSTAATNKKYFLVTHPVNSIYITIASDENTAAKMATKYGGTWEAYGAGRVLVSYNSGDASFNSAGKTGGEKTHTLTTSEIPSHTHGLTSITGYDDMNFINGSGSFLIQNSDTTIGWGQAKNAAYKYGNTGASGSGGAHNNLQPYITVYMYRRTA